MELQKMSNDTCRVLNLLVQFQKKLAAEGVSSSNIAELDALFGGALTIHKQKEAAKVVVHALPYDRRAR